MQLIRNNINIQYKVEKDGNVVYSDTRKYKNNPTLWDVVCSIEVGLYNVRHLFDREKDRNRYFRCLEDYPYVSCHKENLMLECVNELTADILDSKLEEGDILVFHNKKQGRVIG